MNVETASEVCSRSGAPVPANAPRPADGDEPARKVCMLAGQAGPAAGPGPALPALEAEFWDRRYAEKAFVWTPHANQYLVDEVESLAPGMAVDLAAGEGRNAMYLAERGWTVQAMDFSEVAMEKARRLAADRGISERVSFGTADLRQYELAPRTFDLVVFVYLQIPLSDLVPILQRAVAAVAPAGTLLFIAHDTDNLTHGFGGPQSPQMLYRVHEIVEALGKELVVEKASQVKRIVPTAAGEKVAIDLLVRAKRA